MVVFVKDCIFAPVVRLVLVFSYFVELVDNICQDI